MDGATLARNYLIQQAAQHQAATNSALSTVAIVTGVSGDLVAVRSTKATTAGGQLFAHAAGQQIAVGDTVVLLPLDNGSFLAIKTGGVPEWDSSVPMKADVYRKVFVQNTANTASGANTSTYLTAMSQTWSLPSGTYTITGSCALSMKSGYPEVDLRFTVDGVNNDRAGIVPSSTVYVPVFGACEVPGLSGTVTIVVQYKGGPVGQTGQTTSAQNPWADLVAQRTG